MHGCIRLTPVGWHASSVLLCQMRVDLFDQLVSVGAVNLAGILDGLAAGSGAAKAMHTDLKEEGSGIGSLIQNVADDRIFGYDHDVYFLSGRIAHVGYRYII